MDRGPFEQLIYILLKGLDVIYIHNCLRLDILCLLLLIHTLDLANVLTNEENMVTSLCYLGNNDHIWVHFNLICYSYTVLYSKQPPLQLKLSRFLRHMRLVELL